MNKLFFVAIFIVYLKP